MRRGPILLAMLLSGCDRPSPHVPSPQGAEPDVRESDSASSPTAPQVRSIPGTPVPNPTSIVGAWRVAGINDLTLTQRSGITLSISPTEMRAVSQCISFDWSFTLVDGRLALSPHSSRVPPCARTLSHEEAALESAIDGAVRADRLPSNALVLAGPSGSVTLFTQ